MRDHKPILKLHTCYKFLFIYLFIFICLFVAGEMRRVGKGLLQFERKKLCTMIANHNDDCYPDEFKMPIICEGREGPIIPFKFYPYSCQSTPLKHMTVNASVSSQSIPEHYQIQVEITPEDKQGCRLGNTIIFIPHINSRNNPLEMLQHEDIFYETESNIINLNVEVFLLHRFNISCKVMDEFMIVELITQLTDSKTVATKNQEESSCMSVELDSSATPHDSTERQISQSPSAASTQVITIKDPSPNMKPGTSGMIKVQYVALTSFP